MTETIISGKMPVLALRGLAVFPDQTVHFDVGRKKSILALEEAMKNDQNIFLVPQKNLMDNDPGADDLYAIGVVAKVKQVLRSQGENLRVLVTGVCRARIAEMTQEEPFLMGHIRSVPETEVTENTRSMAMRREANAIYSIYCELAENNAQTVQLGVVVGNAQGQLAFLQHVSQLSADLLVSQHEVDFSLTFLCTAHHVFCQDFLEDTETVRGVVEVLDGLMQGFCGEAGQLLLEGAECDGALIEILGSLGGLQADGTLNEVINTPVGILLHMQVGFAVHSGDQGQGTVGIVDLGVQVTGNSGDVFLQTFNIGECAVADLLQNVAAAGLGDHQVSVGMNNSVYLSTA